jgi:hypothetical protein
MVYDMHISIYRSICVVTILSSIYRCMDVRTSYISQSRSSPMHKSTHHLLSMATFSTIVSFFFLLFMGHLHVSFLKTLAFRTRRPRALAVLPPRRPRTPAVPPPKRLTTALLSADCSHPVCPSAWRAF